MSWQDWIFGNLPLQPVQGDPINPAYRQMPNATAPITDVRGMGPSSWMSRPHDQDLQSRNMMGYYRPLTNDQLDAYNWQKQHGVLFKDPPTTPLPDPGYIPDDPSIVARIKAAQDAKDAASGPPLGSMQFGAPQNFTPQQIQSALQYWQGGAQ